MKNVVTAVLLIASVLFAALYVRQTHQTAQAQASAAALQQTVTDLEARIDEQDKRVARLQDQLHQAQAEAAATVQQTTQVQNAGAAVAAKESSAPTNAPASNPLAEMFKNPAMKDMIKKQQKTALGGMIDKNYSALFSQLHLGPEQSTALKELLLNKQLDAADAGISMFTGDSDPTNRAALAQQAKAASDAADAQIKEFLGEDNFAQFQAYEKTLGERVAVNGFQEQLAGGAAPLSDDQAQQLIDAMTQERQNFHFTTDLSDKSKFSGDFGSMFTEDKMNSYFQELGQLNQQYTSRAQSILSADQLGEFQQYLNNQQTMQKAGMQMAAKMFAPTKPSGN